MNGNKKVKKSGSDQRLELILIVGMIIVGIIIAYPLLVVLSTSFSSPAAVMAGKVWLFPEDFSLSGYKAVFRNTDIWTGYRNSLFYMVAGTMINIIMTLMAAYPLSRADMPGSGPIMMLFTFTRKCWRRRRSTAAAMPNIFSKWCCLCPAR